MSKQPELQHPVPIKPVSPQLAPEQHFPGQPQPEHQMPEHSLPEIPVPEDPVQKDLVQDNPAQENSAQENSVQEGPVQEGPVQEGPVQEEPVQEGPVQEEPVQEEPDPCLGNLTPSDDDGKEFQLQERKPEAMGEYQPPRNSYETATTDSKESEYIPSEYIPGFVELRVMNKDPEGVDDSTSEDDTDGEPRKLGSDPQERKHDTPTQDGNNAEAQTPGESNPEEIETRMPLEGGNDERSQPPSNSGPSENDPHRTSLGSQPPNNSEPAGNNPPPESRNTSEPTSNPETMVPNTDGASEFQSYWSETSSDDDQPLSLREKLGAKWERCRERLRAMRERCRETLTATCETLRAMPERCREALRAKWERCRHKTGVLVDRTGHVIQQSTWLGGCIVGVVRECWIVYWED